MSIGEFQNRPGLGTGAKRASDQDLSESGGLGCTEGKENGYERSAVTREDRSDLAANPPHNILKPQRPRLTRQFAPSSQQH
jgi:hypothetical protein